MKWPLIFGLLGAIFGTLLMAALAHAQVATDDEIARAWAVCAPMEASGILAAQLAAKGIPPWRTGYEKCAAVKVAYSKSKAGIDAKAAADKAAADKAAVDALAGRLVDGTGGKK